MGQKNYKLNQGFFVISIVLFLYVCGNAAETQLPVRNPAVADAFYPGDPVTLRDTVQTFIQNAGNPVVEGELVALMAPHAGYVFSGQVAAYSYKELQNRHYDTVILIGPSHFSRLDGAAIFTRGYYASPSGKVPVNTELAEKIVSEKLKIYASDAPHNTREHCLEVQLPFLQSTLKTFSVVPVLIGQVDEQFCRNLAATIADAVKDTSTLIVASTDLSHYPPYEIARSVDQEMLKLVTRMKPLSIHPTGENLVRQYRDQELHTCMCGEWAVITTMFVAEKLGADKSMLLKYANSGDVSFGKKHSVVGYGAVAFYRNR